MMPQRRGNGWQQHGFLASQGNGLCCMGQDMALARRAARKGRDRGEARGQSWIQIWGQGRLLLALAASLSLSGCADGIDFNGKVFDVLGVSPAAVAARKTEPKLAERAPLVLPPDSARLPEPGSGQTAEATVWPDDPEQRKLREAQERERLHLAYCRGDIQWKERAMNPGNVNSARSPYGPCPSLIGDLSGINKQ